MAKKIGDKVLDFTPYNSLMGEILDNKIIQPDVLFRIFDRAGEVLKGSVMAHRFVLSAASPVFRLVRVQKTK